MAKLDLHSGSPFWPLRDGLLWAYPALEQDAAADVLVVGAGITGAAIAYELARSGASVVVVDRRDVASGSSAASSGLLLYDTDTPLEDLAARIGMTNAARVYQLGARAIDDLESFCQQAEHDCGFARRPTLYLASETSDVAALRCEHDQRISHGFSVEWLDRDALQSISTMDAPAAMRAAGTAEVDSYRLTHQLLRGAVRHGARVFDRTEVAFPSRQGTGFVATTDRGCRVASSRVVWAAGYEASAMAKSHGNLASTWVLVTEPLKTFEGWPDRCLVWETARPYVYIRGTEDGRMMIGGEDEPGGERHRSASKMRRKIERLRDRARKMFPKIPIEVAFAWSGTFSLTDDGLPIIEELERWPGLWTALGYGGNGITFAVIAARIIGDKFAGRPNEDGALFSSKRGIARCREERPT